METINPLKKTVAIFTNNLHCERHVQYYSTVEKYFVLNGWSISNNFNSDKIVICGCGFIDTMFDRIHSLLNNLKSINFLEKNIIILGCLPKTHENSLNNTFNGHVIELHKEEQLDKLVAAKIPFVEVENVHVFRRHFLENPNKNSENFHVKISEGCLKECTFCVINKVKGYIKSFPKEEILKQVKRAFDINNPNVMLIGEDTFAYGIDIDTNIVELIKYIKKNEPRVNLSFGYLHQRWLAKYYEEIFKLCKEGAITRLHIGVQHVSNSVLTRMGRKIDFNEVYKMIKSIKAELPHFDFGCDIMVGFPGETEADFNELINFFQNDKCFTKVQHFGYSDVTGAPSVKFEDKVPSLVILDRWQKLNSVLGQRSYTNELNESKIDDETFKITRFEEIFYCNNTFYHDLENVKVVPNEIVKANFTINQDDIVF